MSVINKYFTYIFYSVWYDEKRILFPADNVYKGKCIIYIFSLTWLLMSFLGVFHCSHIRLSVRTKDNTVMYLLYYLWTEHIAHV